MDEIDENFCIDNEYRGDPVCEDSDLDEYNDEESTPMALPQRQKRSREKSISPEMKKKIKIDDYLDNDIFPCEINPSIEDMINIDKRINSTLSNYYVKSDEFKCVSTEDYVGHQTSNGIKFKILNTDVYLNNIISTCGSTSLIFLAFLDGKKLAIKFTDNTDPAEFGAFRDISEMMKKYKYPHFVLSHLQTDHCKSIEEPPSEKKAQMFAKYIPTINKNYAKQSNLYKMYVMEHFDGDISSLIFDNKTTLENYKSIVGQIYVSILIMHLCFKYRYSDSHLKNFFYKKLKSDKREKYLHYRIFGKDVYIRIENYFVVLGDYGSCTKVLSDVVVEDFDLCNYLYINQAVLSTINNIKGINDIITNLNFTEKMHEKCKKSRDAEKETIKSKYKDNAAYSNKSIEEIFICELIEHTDLFIKKPPHDSIIINKDNPYIIPLPLPASVHVSSSMPLSAPASVPVSSSMPLSAPASVHVSSSMPLPASVPVTTHHYSSGGMLKKKEKKNINTHIIYNDKRRKIYFDDNKKRFIKYEKKNIYLSTIKGKYRIDKTKN